MKNLNTHKNGLQNRKNLFTGLMIVMVLLFCKTSLAQDTIYLRNSLTIPARITEITLTEVKYKKANNLNGPSYTLLKSEVKVIRYENGTEDNFPETSNERNTYSSQEPKPTDVPFPKNEHPKNVDYIITKEGYIIYCKILEVGDKKIRYQVHRKGSDINGVVAIEKVTQYKTSDGVKVISVMTLPEKKEQDDFVERRHYSGPRVGLTVVGPGAGQDALRMEGKRNVYSQFGWQFETRMFTLENGTSGMLEFVPMVGGVDMAKFIPSFSGLIGLRTREGFEFGVGPNLAFFSGTNSFGHRYTTANLGIVLAAGMSLKSGKVYFPINIAFVPSITQERTAYDPVQKKNVTMKYETGAKISLLIGFNNRSR